MRVRLRKLAAVTAAMLFALSAGGALAQAYPSKTIRIINAFSPSGPSDLLLTVAEQGLAGFEAVSWYALMAPAGTQKEIVAKIAGEVNRILKMPDVVARLEALGATPAGGTPEELARVIRAESARIAPVVKAANIQAN